MTAQAPSGTAGPSVPDGGPGMDCVAGRTAVLNALSQVRDPELDEPITALGFVASVAVSQAGHADVRLRLPTYFCAPNFAFLMVADAYDAVTGVAGVHGALVVLEDHFAGEAINSAVAARAGFAQAFAGEARGELDQLRADFLRKAVMAGTDLVCRPLLAAGMQPDALASMTLGEVPPSRGLERLRQRRAELGLPAGDLAPLIVDPATGAAVTPEALPLHLRKARTTRVSVQSNTGICRGMLRHRYTDPGIGEEDSA